MAKLTFTRARAGEQRATGQGHTYVLQKEGRGVGIHVWPVGPGQGYQTATTGPVGYEAWWQPSMRRAMSSAQRFEDDEVSRLRSAVV